MSLLRRPLLLSALALAGAPPAAAQDVAWPTRPIRMINPWTPGGPADVVARPITVKLSEVLGQPVVLENRPGANGMIGAGLVAAASPDGPTLLFGHVGPIAISPATQARMPYDTLRDFAPVTQVVSSATALVVRPGLPVRTVPELLDYARAHPGVTYGSVGPGSTTHLAGEMLQLMGRAPFTHVPYQGAAPVMTDLLGGRIDIAFLNVAGVLPQIAAGGVRGIAVSTLRRAAALPDLPTVSDTLPGFEVNSWYGVLAPAAVPQPIIDRLYREIAVILRTPEITRLMNQNGLDVEASTPAEFRAKIEQDLRRWAEVVRAVGLRSE